jgi:hypothetical protein
MTTVKDMELHRHYVVVDGAGIVRDGSVCIKYVQDIDQAYALCVFEPAGITTFVKDFEKERWMREPVTDRSRHVSLRRVKLEEAFVCKSRETCECASSCPHSKFHRWTEWCVGCQCRPDSTKEQ